MTNSYVFMSLKYCGTISFACAQRAYKRSYSCYFRLRQIFFPWSSRRTKGGKEPLSRL